MAKQTGKISGTPLPWIELCRQHWAQMYQAEVHVRPGPRGTLVEVPYGKLIIPELLDDDDDEEGDDDEDSDGDDDDVTIGPEGEEDDDDDDGDDDDGVGDHSETFSREGPGAAAEVASSLYKRCGSHVRQSNLKAAYFQLSVYDKDMKLLGKTTTGGHIRADGAVQMEDWSKETDRERSMVREDWMWKQFQECVAMNLTAQRENAAFMSSVTALVRSAMDSKAEIAGKHLEHEEAKLDADVAKSRHKTAAKSWDDTIDRLGPSFEIFVAGYHANATRRQSNREPHGDPFIESGRTLLDAFDGEAMVYLLPVVGPEAMGDVLRVLGTSLEENPDRRALAHAWGTVADGLLGKVPQILKELPDDLAKRLAGAVQAFHLMAERIRKWG